jgi:alpha-L-rhamnosidase
VKNVYYSNITPYGKVISEIIIHKNLIEINVTIPVGSYATIYIPIQKKNTTIKENGININTIPFIKKIGTINNYYILEIKQGTYYFSID